MTDTIGLSRLAGRPLIRMNGVGNAIALLDLRATDIVVEADEARAIAARPGLGFDQLMAIHDAREPGTTAHIRIYNNDGSVSGACGNGTRCVAWYLLRNGNGDDLVLSSAAGRLVCARIGPTLFSVDMGVPTFAWDTIPLRDAGIDPKAVDLGLDHPSILALGRPFAVGMGNPHAVFFVNSTEAVDLAGWGSRVEYAPAFPERVNVSFAEIVDRGAIRLRVWERGAGATLGCGSGACATLVAAAATGRTDRQATVDLPGGRLSIEWRDDDHVLMTGPVELEFEAILDPREQAA